MGRRYSRSGWGWSGAEWAEYHQRRRAELTRRFGGIDEDVEKIFLSLDQVSLRALLREYAGRYGDGAAAYARGTYGKWKAGTVLLSGQTAERLLDLLPPYLSNQVRYELIRKLRHNCLPKLTLNVACEPANWREAVQPAVAQVVSHFRAQNLPPYVTSVATWLTRNDAKAAQALLARAEEEEAVIRTRLLAQEFQRLEALLGAYEGARTTIRHVISLPQGNVHVRIRPPGNPIWLMVTTLFQRLWS
jgi:hypothetical protein